MEEYVDILKVYKDAIYVTKESSVTPCNEVNK